MTAGVLALGLATMAVAGFGASVLVRAALPLLDRAVSRLTPRGASHTWRAAAFAPAFTGLATFGAVFGLVPDHCVSHGPHHPHLCFEHAVMWPAGGVAVLAGVFAARGLVISARAAWRGGRSSRVVRGLESAGVAGPDGARRVPGSQLWAVTAGLLRPRVYLSDALAADADAPIVLEHERAHAGDRHALWQWMAFVASVLHVPGVAGAIGRRLAIAQEMMADDTAARAIGDRPRVAAALVRLARHAPATPAGATGFGASAVEIRVRALLSEPRDGGRAADEPAIWIIRAAAVMIAAAIAASAGSLHHALETFFGYLG